MYVTPKLSLLSQEQCEQLHSASMEVFARSGTKVMSEPARKLLGAGGARVDGQKVYLPEAMVMKALETVPRQFVWRARNPEREVTVGLGGPLIIQPNLGCVFVEDIDQGRRTGTSEDFANIQKLCQSSAVVQFAGASPCEAEDLSGQTKTLEMFYLSTKHSDKPVLGLCQEGVQANEDLLDLAELAVGGPGAFKGEAYVGMTINPFSPLTYDACSADSVMAFARRGQVVMINTCSMAGVTGPVNPLAMMVSQNCEVLTGLVLAQLVRPGTPVISGASSSIANLRQVSYLTAAPEMSLMYMACLDLYKNFYHLPTKLMAGMTDSKMVDVQTGYETMQNFMTAGLGGVDLIDECMGLLDSFMTTSMEKIILDEEMISRLNFLRRGLEFSQEAMLLDEIIAVGSDGAFLDRPSTIKKFRQFWQPSISESNSYGFWEKQGRRDILTKANEKWKERLALAPESLLSPDLDKDLRAFIGRVEAR